MKNLGYWLTKNGKVFDVSGEFSGGTNDHVGFLALTENNIISKSIGLTKPEIEVLSEFYTTCIVTADVGKVSQKVFSLGNIRIRIMNNILAIDTYTLNNIVIDKVIDLLNTKNIRGLTEVIIETINNANTNTYTLEEFFNLNL